ncbi:helix-turn-helix domain-containing protein [Rathayibacter tritici]|uniref:helix-turn-helix domain-containing protein n=1 Tax=Rathayibacter tritici TaxID=33888 RepID=UPI001476806C|nr:helix-turn-helix transcriptional regulator [Rathayibacter tritici]
MLTRSLGRGLRAAMAERRTTLAEAAHAIDVSEGQLSKMLHGKRRIDIEKFDELCQFLELDSVEAFRAAKAGERPRLGPGNAVTESETFLEDVDEFSRRLRFLARRHPDDPYTAASRASGRIGVALSFSQWEDLLDGAMPSVPAGAVSVAISVALGADGAYLRLMDADAAERFEAQLELEETMRRTGTARIAARNLSGLGVDEIRAIADLLRRAGGSAGE